MQSHHEVEVPNATSNQVTDCVHRQGDRVPQDAAPTMAPTSHFSIEGNGLHARGSRLCTEGQARLFNLAAMSSLYATPEAYITAPASLHVQTGKMRRWSSFSPVMGTPMTKVSSRTLHLLLFALL